MQARSLLCGLGKGNQGRQERQDPGDSPSHWLHLTQRLLRASCWTRIFLKLPELLPVVTRQAVGRGRAVGAVGLRAAQQGVS